MTQGYTKFTAKFPDCWEMERLMWDNSKWVTVRWVLYTFQIQHQRDRDGQERYTWPNRDSHTHLWMPYVFLKDHKSVLWLKPSLKSFFDKKIMIVYVYPCILRVLLQTQCCCFLVWVYSTWLNQLNHVLTSTSAPPKMFLRRCSLQHVWQWPNKLNIQELWRLQILKKCFGCNGNARFSPENVVMHFYK